MEDLGVFAVQVITKYDPKSMRAWAAGACTRTHVHRSRVCDTLVREMAGVNGGRIVGRARAIVPSRIWADFVTQGRAGGPSQRGVIRCGQYLP